jgi:hypothetical protein
MMQDFEWFTLTANCLLIMTLQGLQHAFEAHVDNYYILSISIISCNGM